MTSRRAYVLLTCLYLLALTSIAGLATMQASSLMARHTLQVDRHSNSLLQLRAGVAQVESRLVRGEEILSLGARETLDGCEVDSGAWLRVMRVHTRTIGFAVDGEETRQADLLIYEIQACEGGRARIESSVGVVEDALNTLDEAALPPQFRSGRLSWRQIW